MALVLALRDIVHGYQQPPQKAIDDLEGRRLPEGSELVKQLEERAETLAEAAKEMADVLAIAEEESSKRSTEVQNAESRILQLAAEESQIANSIKRLEEIDPEALHVLISRVQRELQKNAKVGSKRDYMLFGLGVLSSFTISVVTSVIF